MKQLPAFVALALLAVGPIAFASAAQIKAVGVENDTLMSFLRSAADTSRSERLKPIRTPIRTLLRLVPMSPDKSPRLS